MTFPLNISLKRGALMAARGARIIGGCCGTTPSHIAALAKALAEGPLR